MFGFTIIRTNKLKKLKDENVSLRMSNDRLLEEAVKSKEDKIKECRGENNEMQI